MERKYIIKKLGPEKACRKNVWEAVPKLLIDCYPWDKNSYKPKSEVQVFYTDYCLRVRFKVYEKSLKISYFQMNDQVSRDSCVEFFFNPLPACDNRYINIEFNAIGVPLIGVGASIESRTVVDDVDLSEFNIKGSVNAKKFEKYREDSWNLEYVVPFDFIEKYYGKLDFKSGTVMKGNFYKCCSRSEFPHFGCWNPVIFDVPHFHKPEYFGTLIFE